MAKKKQRKRANVQSTQPRSFAGVIRGCERSVQSVAKALRELVYAELPDAQERFTGGRRPLAMYRTLADVCWIQPQMKHCNLYFTRGIELDDPDQLLQGTSDRFRYVRVRAVDELDELPLRAWLRESLELNQESASGGLSFDEAMEKLRTVCLELPNTKETLTWGIPHFRVGEKIFCGCSEEHGRPRIGLKMEGRQSELMMKIPGIEKAPYSRKGDGWVTIDPSVFDDWDEIEGLLVGSYRLIAPKRTVALLDSPSRNTKRARRKSR